MVCLCSYVVANEETDASVCMVLLILDDDGGETMYNLDYMVDLLATMANSAGGSDGWQQLWAMAWLNLVGLSIRILSQCRIWAASSSVDAF